LATFIDSDRSIISRPDMSWSRAFDIERQSW
jgi:hypothetical protein